MIIVTGGTGFIGSAVVWALNQRGDTDIVIVDELDHERKERNVGHLQYERLISIKDFRQQLQAGDFNDAGVTAMVHLGACSDTTETNWDYLNDNNVEYSKDMIRWCVDRGVRCIYASSGATYGDGTQGFSDDHQLMDHLVPLNLYGKSKLLVDVWARDAGYLEQVVGLRYFNIFGPNEWHKQEMRSVICKKFDEVAKSGVMRLFKSDNPTYADGEQERDFLYVKDAVATTLFFIDEVKPTGVFNVGSGLVSTWNQVAEAMFGALGKESNIEYIAMPEQLTGHYQYHTQADITKLTTAGFEQPATPLTVAITDYVQKYLIPDQHLGEYPPT